MVKADNTIIENQSVNIIEELCIKTRLIKSDISKNDKGALWDGFLELYESAPFSKNNLCGRVPIQLKGTEKKIDSFNISQNDLKKYLGESGVFYLLVNVDLYNRSNNKIYYKMLLPFDIKKLIEKNKKNNVNSSSVKFVEFNGKSKDFADLLLQFICERQKQGGDTARIDLTHDVVLDEQGPFKGVITNTYSLNRNILDSFRLASKIGFYLRAESKNNYCPPITFEHIDKAIFSTDLNLEIKIGNEVYYEGVKKRYKDGDSHLCFSDEFYFILPEIEDDGPEDINSDGLKKIRSTFKILDTGYYRDLVKAYSFLCKLIDKEPVYINGELSESFLNKIDIDNEEKIKGLGNFHKNILDKLDYLGLKNVKSSDVKVRDNIFELIGYDEYNIDSLKFDKSSKIPYLFNPISIGERYVFVLLKIDYNNNSFEIFNFEDLFNENFKIVLQDENNQDITDIGKYGILNKEILSCENISADIILKSVKESNFEDEIGYIISLLLQAISAYDSSKTKQSKELILHLSEYIYEKEPNEINFLNLCQVKYRINKLSSCEIEKLKTIASKSEEIQNKIGANIVLKNFREADRLISILDFDIKKNFLEYPIYKLYDKNKNP